MTLSNLGQTSAHAVASVLTDPEGSMDPPFVEEAKEEASSSDLSTDDIIFAFMRDSGALYTYESKENWHLVVAWSMSAALTFGEPQADGIHLQFETVGPTVEELVGSKKINSHIPELNFLASQTSVFLTAP